MFISTLDLFRIGIGPSSSHTIGPMVAAGFFLDALLERFADAGDLEGCRLQCRLKGSLALTGQGHATDKAVLLGLHGHAPAELAQQNVEQLLQQLSGARSITLPNGAVLAFEAARDIIFDKHETLPEHPNGMLLQVLDPAGKPRYQRTLFSIGGGFIATHEQLTRLVAPLQMYSAATCPYPFDSADSMLQMAADSGLPIAQMKRANELSCRGEDDLDQGLDAIWDAMRRCVENGLVGEGVLPGSLHIERRARGLHAQLLQDQAATLNDWLSVYAIAVNEENAAGHMVVTAPTNGAAGVVPAVLYYLVKHQHGSREQVHDFLLTAAAIGGIIKHRSSISGAEVGCQGEVGSAAAMAAAGLCAARGGSPQQVENAAEIALEHHLGMTCDPVAGLVQVPCIERNAFGAVKAYTAAGLALRGSGRHFMSLDNCIAAMRETGREMSAKYKETSLGGLAVSITEC